VDLESSGVLKNRNRLTLARDLFIHVTQFLRWESRIYSGFYRIITQSLAAVLLVGVISWLLG
jgi:hypothetical protein